jgi:hypothetical protein
MSINIKPLTSKFKEDYLSFFESIEFREHPHWADCYCYSFHFTGQADEWKRDNNRACVSSMIDNCLKKIVADYSALQYEFIEVYPRAEEHSAEKLYQDLQTLRLRL